MPTTRRANRKRFFHAQIDSKNPETRHIPIYNLTEQLLESRILSPYKKGQVITLGGVSVGPSDIVRVSIRETDTEVQPDYPDQLLIDGLRGMDYRDFTNVFIKGPPGWESSADVHNTQEIRPQPDAREVFVVHGRNMAARDALFQYLRAIGLSPLEWSVAVSATGKTSPYIGEILDAAFSRAHAIVVLFTPDDEARLKAEFRTDNDPPHEAELTGQARLNVYFEAGMSMGRNPDRTVLVEVGKLRPFTDLAGIHVVRMDGSSERRQELAQRLRTAGCPVNTDGTDWHRAGNFEGAVTAITADSEQSQGGIEQGEADSQSLRLSAEARDLLIEATNDDSGIIMVTDTLGGMSIQTNRKPFGETGDPRSEATWKGAIDDLVKAGFLTKYLPAVVVISK